MKKVALVTGASEGIGLSFARLLAGYNHDLVMVARNEKKLEGIKNNLCKDNNINVSVIAADLTGPDGVASVYKKVRDHGLDVEILINNAGMGDWGFFKDCDWAKQEQMIRLNIIALTHLTRLVLPSMVNRRYGKILNIASTAAFQPGPLMSVYYATKAYVLSFSQALANEVKDRGVTVTCLCPGPTATRFQDSASIKNIRMNKNVKLSDPFAVAQYGYRQMFAGNPVATHGRLNQALALSARILPRNLTLEAVRFMQSPPNRLDRL